MGCGSTPSLLAPWTSTLTRSSVTKTPSFGQFWIRFLMTSISLMPSAVICAGASSVPTWTWNNGKRWFTSSSSMFSSSLRRAKTSSRTQTVRGVPNRWPGLTSHLKMEQREEMVHQQQLDVFLEPAQGKDVVPDTDRARRAEQVAWFDIPLEVDDVFHGVIFVGAAGTEEPPPAVDTALAIHEREDGLRRADLVPGHRDAIVVLLVGVAAGGVLVADLEQDAVAADVQVEQGRF